MATGIVAHRKFYGFDDEPSKINSVQKVETVKQEDLFAYVNKNIIGSQTVFSSPYGPRKVTYCDYIASGRCLEFIEDYIKEQVLPCYGSTHTTTSVTSLQTSLFRHEARDIIRNAIRASEHDRIIFTGSGTTGAINKLIHGMKFESTPIVYVDFTAHHSAMLPWREIGAVVYRVQEDRDGNLDLNHLESLLKDHQPLKQQMIGCFSAASNITGVILDDVSVTLLLHNYGALAFWDYATAAPYLEIAMNPHLPEDLASLAHKDAIFFSLHKFLGGVQTPGVLVAKKHVFRNDVPLEAGGGTVFFVSRKSHRYLKDVEEREEGGTPAIVEAIRGGMVMQLKMNLTPERITSRCFELSRKISEFVSTVPQLIPLGNVSETSRLPILSFNVRHPGSGRLLHYNFVSAVLNDVFGIQSRGGCACAGPYAQDLLGMDESLAQQYEARLVETPSLERSHLRRKEEHSDVEVLRPGFVRLNLSYTADDEQIDFIFSALRSVSDHAWKLLPQYIFNPETGEWKHTSNLVFTQRQWLQNISYSKGVFEPNLKRSPAESPSYDEVKELSETIFAEAYKIGLRTKLADQLLLFRGKAQELLWFLTPSEAQKYLENSIVSEPPTPPFSPVVYPLTKVVLSKRPNYVWRRKKTERLDLNDGSPSSLILSSSNMEGSEGGRREPTEEFLSVFDEGETLGLPCENGTCSLKERSTLDLTLTTEVKSHWAVPPKTIFNPTVEALQSFHMIEPDDKVLVCLSGGKDSLSLLHTLRQYQFYAKSKGTPFSLGAVTVDPQSSSYDPRPLIPYLKVLGVPYFYEEQGILKQAMEVEDLNSICSFCSRMKRGRIYAAARREGYNVLALGQHLDDLAESFLMSVFHNGRLRTMKASYTVREGDLRVIRPFVYVREKELREFAESRKLPIIPENCPACFESPKERHRVKQLLAQQEVLYPNLFWSLKTAFWPIISIDKTGLENSLFGKKYILTGNEEEENE